MTRPSSNPIWSKEGHPPLFLLENEKMENSKVLALDVDDVLVHISTPWVVRALEHPRLGQLLTSLRFQTPALLHQVVVGRSRGHIQPWLVEQHGLPASSIPEFDSLYRDAADFYDDLEPTVLFKGVLTALGMDRVVSHVHIITHCFALDDAATLSKRRWLERHLADGIKAGRVTIHELTADQRKSEVMCLHCPEAHSFADDSVKNVIDVLLNKRVRPHEILIPRMAHNDNLPVSIRRLAHLRRIKLSYYDNIT